jgi:hypothetical protein
MTSTDFDPSSAEVDGPAISCLVSTALSRAEKTTAITKVRYLKRELFDDGGHVRKGVVAAQADEIVGLINDLRQALGWLEVDLDGRWRRPANAARGSTTCQRVAWLAAGADQGMRFVLSRPDAHGTGPSVPGALGYTCHDKLAPSSIDPLRGPKLQPSPRIINSDSSSLRRPGRVDNAEPGTALVDRP